MNKISCAIIVKNEIENLKKLLPQLEWLDEIIIVDSGSNDGTEEFLNSQNNKSNAPLTKYYQRNFDGYGPQKRFAVSKASNDWTLSLDADEIPSARLIQEIQEFLKNPQSFVGVNISFVNVFLGREIHLWGSKDYHLRLFNKKFGNYNQALVHELVEVRGPVVNFKSPVRHYSYKSVSHYFEKFNRYTSWGAEMALRKKSIKQARTTSVIELSLRIKVKFIALYFLRGGFLSGYPGFVWCLFSAFYPTVKYIKMNEIIKNQTSLNQSPK
jgi:glycosyltransferase involved in cell wall biosynthesis